MTPEAKARQQIGWVIQDMKQLNLAAGAGVPPLDEQSELLISLDLNDEPASVLLERIRAERAARDTVKNPRDRRKNSKE